MTAYRNPNSEVAHNFPSSPYRGTVIEDLLDHVDTVLQPSPPPVIDQAPTEPLKFNAAFIERRMAEHREWQERTLLGLAADVVTEVASAIGYVQGRRGHRTARLK